MRCALDEIGTRSKEVASLFEINIGTLLEYDAILKKANEALVEITLQSQQHATALQEKASTLAQQNQQLKIQATTDGLTGLANRVTFDQFLAEQFAAAMRGESRWRCCCWMSTSSRASTINTAIRPATKCWAHWGNCSLLQRGPRILPPAMAAKKWFWSCRQPAARPLPRSPRAFAALSHRGQWRARGSRCPSRPVSGLPATSRTAHSRNPPTCSRPPIFRFTRPSARGRNCVRIFAVPKGEAKSTAA